MTRRTMLSAFGAGFLPLLSAAESKVEFRRFSVSGNAETERLRERFSSRGVFVRAVIAERLPQIGFVSGLGRAKGNLLELRVYRSSEANPLDRLRAFYQSKTEALPLPTSRADTASFLFSFPDMRKRAQFWAKLPSHPSWTAMQRAAETPDLIELSLWK